MPAKTLHASKESIHAVRALLRLSAAISRCAGSQAAIASTLRSFDEEEEPTDLASTLDQFVPTAVKLQEVSNGSDVRSRISVDNGLRPRYVTSLHVETNRRRIPEGAIARMAVIAEVAPPAQPSEADDRARILAEMGIGLPFGMIGMTRLGGVLKGLTKRERRRAQFIPLDEQIALGTILAVAGKETPVVAFSQDADWPRNPLALEVAARLNCRVQRFRLGLLPGGLIERLSSVRYEYVKLSAYRGESA